MIQFYAIKLINKTLWQFCNDNNDHHKQPVLVTSHPGSLDGSLIAPSLDSSVSLSDRLRAVRTVLQHRSTCAPCTKVIFDLKCHYKLLSRVCGICLEGPFEDPKIANWMLDPDAKESPLHRLVNSFVPAELPLLQCKGQGKCLQLACNRNIFTSNILKIFWL